MWAASLSRRSRSARSSVTESPVVSAISSAIRPSSSASSRNISPLTSSTVRLPASSRTCLISVGIRLRLDDECTRGARLCFGRHVSASHHEYARKYERRSDAEYDAQLLIQKDDRK